MKIFSGSSNEPLAKDVAKALGTSLSPLEIFVFPDGERRIQIQERVVDEDTVVVQSTATPADTSYMELFFIIDGLQRSGARSVTVVMPYMGYQRQDHVFRTGEAVSFEIIVKTLEALKVDKVIAFDMHTIKIPEFFHIPIAHLSALPLFAKEIQNRKWDGKDSALVTPDMGGIRRIKIISEMLGNMSYAVIEKNRDLATGKVEAAGIEGEVRKRALIVDDMISSGGTIVKAGELLKKKGAEHVDVFVTHGIFSEDAQKRLQESLVDTVFVTDSVFIPQDKYFAKLEIISLADTIARELQAS